MRALALISLVLLAGCQSAPPVAIQDATLTQVDLARLERRASSDPSAAWQLSNYYAFEVHEEAPADRWLVRAAVLGHPQAERSLAYLIKEDRHSPAGFGTNAPAAVHTLLERSARTEGNACHDLATAYAEGYFGSPEPAKARARLQRGAGLNNRACWTELSRYCRQGRGGPRDDAEAYHWISLETRCVDPRSVSGQEAWQAREEIASRLPPAVLRREWQRVDAFVDQVSARKVTVDDTPFLEGAIKPKLVAEGRRLSQQREDEHRRRWRPAGG